MKQVIDLKDKRILVVGASSGMGKATAMLLSELDASVDLMARREELLEKTLYEMNNPGKHRIWRFDVRNTSDIQGWFEESLNSQEELYDGMVYCAGIDDALPLRALTPTKLIDTFQVNIYPFIEFVRAFVKKSFSNSDSSIVCISSNASSRSCAAHTSYCASKAAIDAATRAMSIEVGTRRRIRINTVNPGYVNTDLISNHPLRHSNDFEAGIRSQYLGLIEAEDVANLIVFLLSDASRMITGENIAVQAGVV